MHVRNRGFAGLRSFLADLGDAAPFRAFERGFEVSVAHAGGGIGNTPDGWGNDYFDDIYQVKFAAYGFVRSVARAAETLNMRRV